MLALRLLGGFEVSIDGVPVKVAPAPGRLLCRLAVDANRLVLRSRLWADLWDKSDTIDVVDQNLRRLKHCLGSEGERLRLEGASVRLDLSGADVDFLRFQEQVESEEIEGAITLYRGEFLQGYLEDGWLLDLRDELKTDYEDALKTLAENALSHEHFLVAARYLRRFIASNPEYEWGWFALIDTYLRWGNLTDALVSYADYVEHIRENNLPPSTRIEERVTRARAEQQDRSVREIREPAVPSPAVSATLAEGLVVGGALPCASPFYGVRPGDAQAFHALSEPGATVLIKGPRQVGKSSLLARALRNCRDADMFVLHTDWQNLSHKALESEEAFYQSLAYKLADQANLDADPTSVYRPSGTPGGNFDRFVGRLLVPAAEKPIVWAIDEADRIFSCDFRDDVFGKLRAWHNDRALDPAGPWAQFSLILSYSTEAHLFITNLNQSPFNVGTHVSLTDFTPEQTADLHERYGSPFGSGDALERLQGLVGGHPYLTSRAFYEAKRNGLTLDRLEETADQADGVFADHLEHLRFVLGLAPTLAAAVRAHLREGIPPTPEQFLRLCSAGVMAGTDPAQMRPRCALYERYLLRMLD